MTVHPKMPLLTHPHPDPPLEGEGNSLSLRERARVRVGIFIPLCEPQGLMTVHPKMHLSNPPLPPFEKGGLRGIFISICNPRAHVCLFCKLYHIPIKDGAILANQIIPDASFFNSTSHTEAHAACHICLK